MKILLTGGAGYIGSHTAVELIAAGYDVVIADNFSNSSPTVLDRLQQITGQKIHCYPINVCDTAQLEKVFSEQKIDGVIHFAGFKAVGESVRMPLSYYRNNIDSALSVLEIMNRFSCHCFVFSSSATVYGAGSCPLMEDMPAMCINPYGRTKWMIEQIATDFAASDSEFSAVLLRYFNPIGAHTSGLIGDDPSGIPNNLFPYITRVAAGELSELPVFGNDYPTLDGTGVRDYIHVVDLARGHVRALQYGLEHMGSEVFNLGTGNGFSVLEMIHAFELVNNVKIPYRIEPRRPGDLAECYAGTSKAARILGWRAKLELEDMCRDAWHWQKTGAVGR